MNRLWMGIARFWLDLTIPSRRRNSSFRPVRIMQKTVGPSWMDEFAAGWTAAMPGKAKPSSSEKAP